MDYFTLIEERHSIRAYQQREVEDDKLRKLLHAANRAPSAGDLQAYQIVAVRSPAVRQALARAALDQDSVAQAPVILVFLADPGRARGKYGHRGETLYSLQDATIACAYAQLAARDLGLGSCWVGAFRKDAVREAIGSPPEQVPVALLPLGYPAEEPRITPRRSLTDLVRRI
jgi:nitroreductase